MVNQKRGRIKEMTEHEKQGNENRKPGVAEIAPF